MENVIPAGDLRVEALWPESHGGQHAGVRIPAIRVTHIPSGLTATCESQRSQHRNRQVAIDMILGGLTSPAYQGQ